jgi:hypothetical protein
MFVFSGFKRKIIERSISTSSKCFTNIYIVLNNLYPQCCVSSHLSPLFFLFLHLLPSSLSFMPRNAKCYKIISFIIYHINDFIAESELSLLDVSLILGILEFLTANFLSKFEATTTTVRERKFLE